MKHRSEAVKRDGAKTGALVSCKTRLVSPLSRFILLEVWTDGRPVFKRFCKGMASADKIFKIDDAKTALTNACRRLGLL
jgi:hypothetical protein